MCVHCTCIACGFNLDLYASVVMHTSALLLRSGHLALSLLDIMAALPLQHRPPKRACCVYVCVVVFELFGVFTHSACIFIPTGHLSVPLLDRVALLSLRQRRPPVCTHPYDIIVVCCTCVACGFNAPVPYRLLCIRPPFRYIQVSSLSLYSACWQLPPYAVVTLRKSFIRVYV